ncbi:serine hydrolase domain-containing protein [Tahibacter soli]|uniref:Serine hydrolase n=1 Tax=Tahibacter soli TaxID=2983605 RepID=A0A9X4BK70_9GAMM|nr:serine hydrolase [Tahibacter soli]MDC8015433.1 serine hydrolase [Tahibacter soli]
MQRLIAAFVFTACAGTAAAYTAPAARDDGWAVADAKALGWDVSRFDAVAAKVADKTYPDITSLVVAQRGKLVYEAYFGAGGADVLNDMRSATKSVTALLVGLAIDRGLIPGVDAKVYAYFADKAPAAGLDPRKAAITLEDLLTMSSIWQCDDENPATAGNEERMYVSEDWVQFALDLPVRGYAPWDKRPKDSPYGRTFAYCTAGSFMLGAVVERATKQPLAKFAHDALEAPLGIDKVQWNVSSEGVGMGGGGTRYRSRDVAKIGETVRTAGQWNGRRVISKAWIDAALTPRAVPRDDVEYGYQFWRFKFPVRGKDTWIWAMSGNGGNYVFVSPELELVAVVTSTGYNKRDSHPRSQEVLREYLLKALPAKP